jgi:hypothetical protein
MSNEPVVLSLVSPPPAQLPADAQLLLQVTRYSSVRPGCAAVAFSKS